MAFGHFSFGLSQFMHTILSHERNSLQCPTLQFYLDGWPTFYLPRTWGLAMGRRAPSPRVLGERDGWMAPTNECRNVHP